MIFNLVSIVAIDNRLFYPSVRYDDAFKRLGPFLASERCSLLVVIEPLNPSERALCFSG
jgi:hypothetical protein